jgi:nucleotide-binding universal stress UspA family protein
MSDGFNALSRGYMERFLKRAGEAQIEVEAVVEEGRNYVGLGKIIGDYTPSMVVAGASGLGDLGDRVLGSTVSRLLRSVSCDLLIGRASAPTRSRGPVLTGIDGSGDALEALKTAIAFANMTRSSLVLLAAYDPELHQRVFKAMSDTMPPEAQAAVGLDKQQDLHESLIDDGLGSLYQNFLDEARDLASAAGIEPAVNLVADKGYRGIISKAEEISASLICLGRFGHNREPESAIGANAENAARLAGCHVLIKAPPPAGAASDKPVEDALEWDPEALARLEKVPRFVRKMARKSIEKTAQAEGADRVTVRHVDMVSERFRGK